MAGLIGIEEARRLVLEEVEPLPAEEVALGDALGRVLAEELTSPVDVPPFDTSAMDGFALASAGGGTVTVIGESRAGQPADVALEAGTAVAISTGAAIPEGTAAVVPVERTEGEGGSLRAEAVAEGANIRHAGDDIRAGQTVLQAGAELSAAALGVMASIGLTAARCARRPRSAVATTGDELVEPGGELAPGHIWSSNAATLGAQIARAGGELVDGRTVADDPAATRAALEDALERVDLLCVSGGVSVGQHDHVKAALAALGVSERFWGVALKPGKPTWFGVAERPAGRVLVFGLPGNPVSAMVTFHLFARPALRALQGAVPYPRSATAVLDQPLRRNPERDQAVRCTLRSQEDGLHVISTGAQESHVLTSMLAADALAFVPRGAGVLESGARVRIELLD